MTSTPSMWEQLLPFALIFIIFYFLIIRPQARRMKDHQKLLQGLKKGDEVLSQSGILGTIDGMTERFVTLKVDEGVRIKILKTQIAGLAKESS